ncbi:MAG: UDP-glucose/GDP-mannose dehydrogenase family protein [Candidatus Pacebacteria bacterium]|nr:UDP-glucose/GDP-mannose dehydrogenase family protein [Candidatus Paceibacterota bacterium]
MKITVVGIGFVGLPLAAAFSSMGSRVCCLDNDAKKIEGLKKGILPITEPGLEPLVLEGLKHKLLDFTTDYDAALADCDILFIAVGTPSGNDGSADLQYVEKVAHTIGQKITKPLIVADKSTVPVGTADLVKKIIQEELDKRGAAVDFWVVSNPEFMAEGRAVKDMLEPSRVVVGSNSKEVLAKMELLYDPFMKKTPRFHAMGVQAAELTKYASNTMLALKISFINTVAGLCDVISADIEEVAEGMGSDPRIGREFLHASLGYGGSCFPKDVKAIIVFADKIGLPKPYLSLLRAIEEVNKYQKTIIPRKILARFGADLTGKKFALWGLSFKAKTNDMRESASIDIVKILTARGAKIVAYDPLAVEEARTVYLKEFSDSISYEQSDKYAILDGCDALIIATETGEYRTIDITVAKKALKNSIIFDGRNLLDIPTLKEAGFEYYAVGRGDRIDWQKIEID